MKPIKIGVPGAGSFARSFIPLFQAHPLVADVYVAEVMPERLSRVVEAFGVATTFTNMEALFKSDADARPR